MAETSKLKVFHIEADGDDFLLRIEGEGETAIELSATREQIDVIADKLDELLSEDDEADEVD